MRNEEATELPPRAWT